ncbi:MAG: hypothetical protein AAFR35_10610 [Pseudomonadota bacterium]
MSLTKIKQMLTRTSKISPTEDKYAAIERDRIRRIKSRPSAASFSSRQAA